MPPIPMRRSIVSAAAAAVSAVAVAVASAAVVALAAVLLVAPRPAAADTQEFGWTAEGFVDPAAGESNRGSIAIGPDGAPIIVWSSRLTLNDPYRIVASTFTGTGWTAAAPILPPTVLDDLLPQLSRASDGTLWLAWQRNDGSGSTSESFFSTLMCARFVDGAWSAPESVSTDLAEPNPPQFGIEYSLLGVSRDSAWVAYMTVDRTNPFSTERRLLYRVRSAAGWSAPAVLSQDGQTEWRPTLVASRGRQPVAFFGDAGTPTILRAMRWDGASWSAARGDTLFARAFFQWAAAPDTNGAARLLVMAREGATDPPTDRIREVAWNDAGFEPLGPIAELPVVVGPSAAPQWDGLSLSAGTSLEYRGFWADYSEGGIPILTSIPRAAGGFGLPDIVGHTFSPVDAFPKGVFDASLARWYATWIGAPTSTALRRPKFAWTQDFAGDLGIGGSVVLPDTVRVTVACTGDGAGRTFHVYRLRWDDTETIPPFAPPIPAEAVEIAGSPTSGACPFVIDDLPGPGRYYYYVRLEADGTFPERFARSFSAVEFSDGGGPGGPAERTALRAPRPRPSTGPVSLPFDLVDPGDVALTVHDLLGRPRRRLALGTLTAGSYVSSAPQWDGRDDAGRAVPSGVYFVRLWVDGRALATERLVILR
jgi:hypothetical protein